MSGRSVPPWRPIGISIATGASRRHVYARPYFRGRAVCPAPISRSEACSLVRHPARPGMLLSTGHPAGGAQTGQTVCQLGLAVCGSKTGGLTNHAGTKRLQPGGPALPEITSRSQAWTARTTSSGSATARGVAEPAIQSEITAMRATNWPSASAEARTRKILTRREGLASCGICRSSDSVHH